MFLAPIATSAPGGSTHGLEESSFSIVVDAKDESEDYLVGSLTIDDQIGARRVGSIRIRDLGAKKDLSRFDPRQSIVVTSRGQRLFAGTIERISVQSPGAGDLRFLQIDMVDYNQIADRFFVRRIFDDAGQTCGDIIKSIVSNELAEEGINVDNVADGVQISRAVYNFRRFDSILDEMVSLNSGQYVWFIDYFRKLHFVERTSLKAAFEITDAEKNYLDLVTEKNRAQYRNRQVVRGGRDTTAQQIETFHGDGETRSFSTRFELSDKPTIEVDTGGGFQVIPDEDVGVRGQDTNRKFYYTKADNVIAQDDDETKLSATDTIRVTYIGLFRQLVIEDDRDEIEATAAIEGGSGLYEAVEVNAEIESLEFSSERARGLLSRLGRISETVSYTTDKVSPCAGQFQKIQSTIHGIDSDYLITSVGMADIGHLIHGKNDRRLRYSVTAIDKAVNQSWAEFFRKVLAQAEKAVVGETEQVATASAIETEINLDDTISTTLSDAVNNFADDPYSVWLVPSLVIGKAKIAAPEKF